MNNLQIFKNDEFGEIRITLFDNEPWFVGKDVAEKLGYANTRDAIIYHIDDDDKTDGVEIYDSMGRTQKPILINESGLYSLVLNSKLPAAKKFKRWITNEVIPSIRKHGAYMTPETIEKTLTNPDFIIRLATELKTEQERRKLLENKIEMDKPKILFAESVEASVTTILIRELAKLIIQNGYKIGGNELFRWMRENGYLIKNKGSDYNMPTQYAISLGLFEIKETAITHSSGKITVSKTTKVTGKGQVYFINKFIGGKARQAR